MTPVASSSALGMGTSPRYELRFDDLFNRGHGYAFPCDAHGLVDIDRLARAARVNYFYARTMVGRELHAPVTRVVDPASMPLG